MRKKKLTMYCFVQKLHNLLKWPYYEKRLEKIQQRACKKRKDIRMPRNHCRYSRKGEEEKRVNGYKSGWLAEGFFSSFKRWFGGTYQALGLKTSERS